MSTLANSRWGATRRTWILFITVYFFFLLMDTIFNDENFPHFVYVLLKPYSNFWDWMVPWTGNHILHLSYPITVKPNGSGDTTYNYVMQLLWVVFAALIAIVWAALDRKRSHYNQLAYWLRIVIRYYFAFVLFSYGFIKIIKLQFPSPSLYALTERYGDSSPMGLAWNFVGYSKGYNIFIGMVEVMAGALLFYRRTTLLGSLIAMTVMANVAAMNFAYDIPVKIYSVNLVLVAVYLASFDLERIRNVFFLNKAVPAASLAMPQPRRWKRILQWSLKTLAILFALYSTLWSAIDTQKKYGEEAPKPPLYGIYDVQRFVRNSDTLLPLQTDTLRWKQIIITYPGYVFVRGMSDSIRGMIMNIDTIRRTVDITARNESIALGHFMYSQPDKDHLIFSGLLKKDSVFITMKRFDENNFNLVKRGFHWINEYPFNR